ncbi:hypothetical protein AB0937_11135 [Streptomyces sp. NPDC047880]|uniref:hypothetical protein n=1 Tax=Streptomyces sp. NPDC047880 TaxID=3155626 RepID=UPI003451BE88
MPRTREWRGRVSGRPATHGPAAATAARTLAPVAQPRPFGEAGQDEPALAAGLKPAGEPAQEALSIAPPAS